ncbi:MAG TPA: hypothetical protein VG872_06095 [Acidimicrobiia bacterium]|nr:hypothetical protein [Acidimicrobiia bacterium]
MRRATPVLDTDAGRLSGPEPGAAAVRPSTVRRLILIVVVLAGCAGGATTPVSPELTEPYGCGHGFYLGSPDQTVGLFIRSNLDMIEGASASGTFQLPDDEWTSELTYGMDLFANWCDDVIEPGEPEPLIGQTWSVEGVLQVISLPPNGQCGPARARLQQAMATSPDGERIDLGELDLVNDSWGCFAG